MPLASLSLSPTGRWELPKCMHAWAFPIPGKAANRRGGDIGATCLPRQHSLWSRTDRLNSPRCLQFSVQTPVSPHHNTHTAPSPLLPAFTCPCLLVAQWMWVRLDGLGLEGRDGGGMVVLCLPYAYPNLSLPLPSSLPATSFPFACLCHTLPAHHCHATTFFLHCHAFPPYFLYMPPALLPATLPTTLHPCLPSPFFSLPFPSLPLPLYLPLAPLLLPCLGFPSLSCYPLLPFPSLPTNFHFSLLFAFPSSLLSPPLAPLCPLTAPCMAVPAPAALSAASLTPLVEDMAFEVKEVTVTG